jgi:hypothetical protein
MPDRVELYYLPPSHYCASAERMLAYKEVSAKGVYAAYRDRAELLRRTGPDHMPPLVWNVRAVPWKEIPAFLDRDRPDPPLVRKGQAGVAAGSGELGPPGPRRAGLAGGRHPGPTGPPLRRGGVFEEARTRARGPWHVQKARRPEFVRGLDEYFGYVDEMVRDREWVLGTPSIADFGNYGGLSPWMTVGERIPSRFPSLRA